MTVGGCTQGRLLPGLVSTNIERSIPVVSCRNKNKIILNRAKTVRSLAMT